MKKTLALLLALVMVLSLCACGSKEETQNQTPTTSNEPTATEEPTTNSEDTKELFFEVGEEAITPNFTFTVNEIGFSDSICIETGDRIGLYSKSGSSVKADDGYGWLYYSVTYKFTGKEKMSAQAQFLPTVQYNDYYFQVPNLRFFKYDGAWHGLDYQFGSGTSLGLPLPATDTMYQYDPWVDKEYELHGAVQVATKAVEDTETPLMLSLYMNMGGEELEKISCVVKIEPPAEPNVEDRFELFTYEDRQFFLEYVKTEGFSQMTEDDISSVLTGKSFGMRNNFGGDDLGNHTIAFNNDGSVDARYTYNGEEYSMYESWKTEGGMVIMEHTNAEGKVYTYNFEVYRFDDARILLLCYENDCSMVLTTK